MIMCANKTKLTFSVALTIFFLLATAPFSVWLVDLNADEPFVSYIFPAGGQRGTTVQFNVGGHNLHDVCDFEMLGAGLKYSPELLRAPKTVWFEGPLIPMPASQASEDYPKDQTGNVSLASDAVLGIRKWRVWTAQGATPTMKFVVGDLPEIVEEEIDGTPVPVRVPLPITINGRIFPREDIDIWTFPGVRGKSYTCEVMAARLGSPLDSRLEVIGPDGQRLAENTDGLGVDSLLRFVAPSDGEYQIHIHDINFGGLQQYVYRLTITDQPYIDHVFPLGGQRGKTLQVQLSGQQVPNAPVTVTLPTTDDPSYPHLISLNGQTTNQFNLQLSDLPEFVEQVTSDEAAYVVHAPAVFNGIIQHSNEVDRWQFAAQQGDVFDIEVWAARLGSPLDSVISIADADGKTLGKADDLAGGNTDSKLQFTAPSDGQFTVSVQDRFVSRGGERFAYRLYVATAQPPQPDFALTLPTDALTVNRGKEAIMKVSLKRQAGFSEAVELKVDHLPASVTLKNTTIPADKNETSLTFTATESATVEAVKITISGHASVAEQTIVRPAQVATTTPNDSPVGHVLLAVSVPTPYKVTGTFDSVFVPRGTTYIRHFTIERGGFEGPLTIHLADRQVRHLQGVTAAPVIVPAGVTEFDFPIKLAPWMQARRTSRTCVMAVGVVEDPNGTRHKVSVTSHAQDDQAIALVDPEEMTIKLAHKSILAKPGLTVDVPFRIGRNKYLDLPVEVDLLVADHIAGVTAAPVRLKVGQDQGVLRVVFDDMSCGPFNVPLRLRATTMPEGFPSTAEAVLQVVVHPTAK